MSAGAAGPRGGEGLPAAARGLGLAPPRGAGELARRARGLLVVVALVALPCLALLGALAAQEHAKPLLGTLAGLLYVVIVLRYNTAGLWVAVAGLGLFRVFVVSLPGLSLSVADLLMIGYCVPTVALKLLVSTERRLQSRNLALLTAFVALCGLSILVSIDLRNSLAYFMRLLLVMGFVVLVADRVRTLDDLENVLLAHVVAGAVLASGVAFEGGSFGRRALYRVEGMASNANALADAMGTAGIVALYLAGHGKSLLRRILGSGAVLVFGAVLLLTYSRWGWVAFSLALLYYAVTARVSKWAALGAAIALVLLLLFAPSLLDMVARRDVFDQSTRSRLATYRSGLRTLLAYPFLGVGLDQYKSIHKYLWIPLDAYQRAPHNIYLKIGAETGALGLLTFLAYVGTALVSSIRGGLAALRRRLARREQALCWTLSALVVHQLLSELSKAGLIYPVFWMVMVLAMLLPDLLAGEGREGAGSPGDVLP